MTMAIAEEHSALIERLRTAEEIVDESNVKTDLRPAAFTEIVRMLDRHADDDRPPPGSRSSRASIDRSSLSEKLAAVAEAFQVDADAINQVFADDEGELTLVVAPRRLSSSTRGAMRADRHPGGLRPAGWRVGFHVDRTREHPDGDRAVRPRREQLRSRAWSARRVRRSGERHEPTAARSSGELPGRTRGDERARRSRRAGSDLGINPRGAVRRTAYLDRVRTAA
jgi:hypothetical protein